MKKEMQSLFQAFSRNLKESDFDKAMKIKEQLLEMNESAASLEKIKISSVDEFKK